MSKAKKNRNRRTLESIGESESQPPALENPSATADGSDIGRRPQGGLSRALRYLRAHLWAVALIAFLSIGAIGAVLKYLDEDAQKQRLLAAKDRSALSSINPFLPPDPTPTPVTHSKDLIYAGSRLLAIEDANANAAPPADLAVWRPSTGVWYVLGGPNSQQTFYTFGTNGDQPVQGDYS